MFTVVYDVDDVLNNLNEYVEAQTKVPMSKLKNFDITKNNNLTEEEKRLVLYYYQHSETFKHLKFRKAAYRIFDIEKTGKARVVIHSNNFNKSIALIKYNMLMAQIPGISPEKVSLAVGNHDAKQAFPNTDIVIDDCLDNLLKYPKECIKIVIDKPWNHPRTYGYKSDGAIGVTRVGSLSAAVELVEKIVNLHK